MNQRQPRIVMLAAISALVVAGLGLSMCPFRPFVRLGPATYTIVPFESNHVVDMITNRSASDEQIIEELRRNPELVSRSMPDGYRPIHAAALYGRHRVLEELLQMGADPNATKNLPGPQCTTAVHMAAYASDCVSVLLLYHYGADFSRVDEEGKSAHEICEHVFGVTVDRLAEQCPSDPKPIRAP